MRFSRIFSIFVTVIAMVAAAGAVQVDGFRAPGSFDARAYEQAQAELAEWLAQAEVAKGLESPVTISLLPEEMAEIQGSPRQAAYKMLVGMTKPVNALVDLEMLELGALRRNADGLLVWSGAVHSEGAAALRVHFTDVNLPAGAELYVYNRNGEAFGPYTGRGPLGSGEFWSHTVTGDTALLQLRGAAPDSYLSIADVGHLGRDFRYARYRQRGVAAKEFCSFNAECVVNAACESAAAVADAADAVAHYQFIQGAFIYMCSGGLIADSSGSGTPYFLTANHCVSRDRTASNVETYFFYTTDCGGSCDAPVGPQTVGASVVATDKDGDYTIMLLAEPAPPDAFFLGWNSDPIALSDGAPLYRISHPAGAPQAYSEHVVSTSAGVCSSWPRGSWIYSKDVVGATEGGSSGSPVVDSDGKIVGQLSGGCGTNVSDVCDGDSNATVDGAFASYYADVQWILGGGGASCDDFDGDGYDDDECGGYDCDDTDPSVNPAADEVCADLIDNDCDGSVDEGCTPCLGRGEPCSSNEECCSGSCHPRKGTCK